MLKQLCRLQKYSIKLLNVPEITYSIYNIFSLRRKLCTNTIESSHESSTSIFEPYSLSNSESIVFKRKPESLYDILNVSAREGLDITTECPKLRKVDLFAVKQRIKIFHNYGVDLSTLLKYPWLLTIPEDQIETKLKILDDLPLTLNECVTFLRQKDVKVLRKICNLLKTEYSRNNVNRMKYVAEKLKCPVDEVCYATARYIFFPKIRFQRLVDSLDILEKRNVPSNQILRDFWVFMYKSSTIATRLDEAANANVENIRTWMVRCKTTTLERTISRHRDNKEVLGNLPSIIEYLSDRLNLDMIYAKTITDKHPEIKRMNITKAKNVIDYLFTEEYTPTHIIRSPRILCCKLETIKKRLSAFKEINYKTNSLVILCKSQAQFDKHFKILAKKLEKEKEASSAA